MTLARLALLPWSRIGLLAGAGASLIMFALWKGAERRADKLQGQVVKYQVAIGQARAGAGRIEREGQRIAKETKERHDNEIARLRSSADTLRLRGPGAARCAPVLPAPARVGARPDPTGSAAVAPVPSGEGEQFAGLPWDSAVALAGNHDALRLSVLAWEEWYKRQSAAWERARP